jgi:Flp pilus assembly protein TadG
VRSWRSILAHEGGNTALIFGLAVVPILALSGGAVDFSRRADLRMQVQSAADSAALAAARIMQNGEMTRAADAAALRATAIATADSLFRAGLASRNGLAEAAPTIEITDDIVRVSAHLEVPTSFLNIIGIAALPANALAEVSLPDATLVEIALVLDYSLSMRDNAKYQRMTAAARSFIQKVGQDRGDRSKIGIVPFSEYVYATLRGGDIRGTPAAQANSPVSACLLNRDYPYSASDSTPRAGVPASRWPQVAAARSGSWSESSSSACAPYAAGGLMVRDLTSDFSTLTDALAGMQPVGLTNIALGAEMGWHLLSPAAPFETARDSSDPKVKKVLVLLTDGVQTVEAMGPGGAVSTEAADEVTAEICDHADAAGIRIFTIAYDITEERVRNLLAGCASSADGYHEAVGADIQAVFDAIFDQIAQSVWLSR